jgi:hypothetical protein
MPRDHRSFDRLLLEAQLNRLRVWLDEVTELTPQRGHLAGVSRCPRWPDCDHAGCEILREVQARATAELERMKVEYRDHRAALVAVQEDEAALERVADHGRAR